jgi:alpha-mannosidase
MVNMNREIARTIRAALGLLALASSLLAGAAHAQELKIWSIGSFDDSSNEFRSQNIDYASPASDPVYVVGKSKASEDWYRFQPGPANGMTGARLHPFTVRFTLPRPAQGVFRLKIAMLYETPRLSHLQVQINRHSGLFYFHPKLDYKAGDWEGTFVPQTSTDSKTIEFPAAWLKAGENEIVLTALDSPETAQISLGAIAPGHTGIVYDALELTNDAAARYEARFTVRVEPTIFYRGSAEVVEVFTSSAAIPKNGSISLGLNGEEQTQKFASQQDFGEQRFEFAIPEWKGSSQAVVRSGAAMAKATASAAKKWTIAIIPHEHLDIGFTDYPAKVAELHSQSIDAAMDLIAKHSDFRWTLDGSWVADQYLAGRSLEAQQRFLESVRQGHIVIPPEVANQHTGNASLEALVRSFYGARLLERRYQLPRQDAAQIVDVPSYTWAYASVLHDAGIKYFVGASNSWRAPVMLFGRWNEKSPFYWEGPDGGRVLMWYARAYLQMHTLFGSPWRMESVRDALPVFLQAYTRTDYTANTAIIFGSQLENTTLAKEQAEIVGTFQKEYTWPYLEFATVSTAMQQIEHEWKGEIPVVRGDFGPYWEDGYGSDALHTAIHRENQHRIASSEILGAALTSIDPLVRPDASFLTDAWRNELLYDEHTWTYVGATTQPENHQSVDQIALKGSRVERARNDIRESTQRGWAQLEAVVVPKDNSIAVFNSLNWARNGMVEADLPEGSLLVDAVTGNEVGFETLWKGKGISLPGFGGSNIRMRFLASNVPAVGYKLYTVKSGMPSVPTKDIPGNILENQYYRVVLDPSAGAIASILDKQLRKELIDQKSAYRFGSYLYVTGGDEYPNNSLYRYGSSLKAPVLTPHPAQHGKLISLRHTPFGTVAKLECSSVNTPHIEVEITLFDAEKKIGIAYHLHKDRVLDREAAYIAFPFSIDSAQFAYGSQSAWIDPSRDELAGGSREWYVTTDWAAVHNQQVTAAVTPLDAPLVNFGDIVRGNWPLTFAPKSSSIFSWLMNNYWGTNFPAWQGGDYTFRYEITSSADFDAAALTRFGRSALTQFEHDDVAGSTEASTLPPTQASLLQVSAPDVSLLTWKLAEDGHGTILRLQETAGKTATATLHSDFVGFEKAWVTSILEDDEREVSAVSGDLSIHLKPFQVVTVRVQTVVRHREQTR